MKADDNKFPKVLLTPVDPSTVTAPSGTQAILLDSTDGNKLKRKAAAGTLTTVEGGGGGGTGDASWTAATYAGTWVSYGAPYLAAAYRKDSNGLVHLRGLVKNGTSGSTIFTLPAGYRPEGQSTHVTFNSATSGTGLVGVNADGTVVHVSGGTAYVSLEIPPFYAYS